MSSPNSVPGKRNAPRGKIGGGNKAERWKGGKAKQKTRMEGKDKRRRGGRIEEKGKSKRKGES